MPQSSQSFVLHVASAEIRSWNVSTFHRAPKLYVKVAFDGRFIGQTQTHERSIAPKWNTDIPITVESEAAKHISIRVMHDASLGRDDCVGAVDIDVNDLLERGRSGLVTLNLHDTHDNPSRPISTVVVQLSAIDLAQTTRVALTNAHEDLDRMRGSDSLITSGIEKIGRANAEGDAAMELDNDMFEHALGKVVERLEGLVPLLDKIATVHPYVNIAWQAASCLYKVIKGQSERDEQMVALVVNMEEVYAAVGDIEGLKEKQTSLEGIIRKILNQTVQCTVFIREYTGHGFAGRTVRQTLSPAASQKITGMMGSFKKLRDSLAAGVDTYTAIVSSRTLEGVENLERLENLKRLDSDEADASTRASCLPGTRTTILAKINEWIMTPSTSGNIFWLSGPAGTGKSTISYTIAEHFDELGLLGAFIPFNRAVAMQGDPSAVVRRLARHLASFCTPFEKAISGVIDYHRTGTLPQALRVQFERFILEPLATIPDLDEQGPIVIVLDALDECGTTQSRKALGLLTLIAQEFKKLSAVFRVLITSRPDADIADAFSAAKTIQKQELQIDAAADEDISIYFKHGLTPIQENERYELPVDWPGSEAIRSLVELSSGLFIWASTAVQFISDDDGIHPRRKLKSLLDSEKQDNPLAGLHDIYAIALQSAVRWENAELKEMFCTVLGTIIVARTPLSDSALDRLLGLDGDRSSRFVLPKLRCVLFWSERGDVIRMLHASFAEYMTSSSACGDKPWFIDTIKYHSSLASATFQAMDQLSFNICRLDSSHYLNVDIQDVEARINSYISPELSYACQFWDDHLIKLPFSDRLAECVDEFLHSKFLFWLEALSFSKNVSCSITALNAIITWLGDAHVNSLKDFAVDAKRFISAFQSPISESAPHVYMSALPFAPKRSLVVQHYRPLFKDLLAIDAGAWVNWSPAILVIAGHKGGVNAVAFSPDYTKLASCGQDGLVCLWNIETGLPACAPFAGHTGSVNAVAFSQDGIFLASGSSDRTVRVWDLVSETESEVAQLQGHTDMVTCVSISHMPNAKYVISGSNDMALRIWDIGVGVKICEGHTCPIWMVCMSFDGKCILSGADDAVMLWEAPSGNLLRKIVLGSENTGYSIACSPDLKIVASASYRFDTVNVWDTQTAELVAGPFSLCMDTIHFSHDGKYILYGDGKNIGVVDARTGGIIRGPLSGHASTINSFAVTPDGKVVASAASDGTIRIWEGILEPAVEAMVAEQDVHLSSMANPVERADEIGMANVGKEAPGWPTSLTELLGSLAVLKDGQTFASCGIHGQVRTWTADGHALCEVSNLPGANSIAYKDVVVDQLVQNSIMTSDDGKRLISRCKGGKIRICDADGHDVICEGHTDEVTSLSLSDCGSYIVSSAHDRTIRRWDTKTGEHIGEPINFSDYAVYCAVFSTDMKKVIFGSSDGEISVWDLDAGKLISGPTKAHTRRVTSIAVSSTHFVSGSLDAKIYVWDAINWTIIHGPLDGHSDWIRSVAFSPDGLRFASGAGDATIRVWDVETGHLVCEPLTGHNDAVVSVVFLADGKHVVSAAGDLCIRVWNVETSDSGTRSLLDTAELDRNTGWFIGPKHELLFWVPQSHREGLVHRRNTAIIGERPSTIISCNKVLYESDWIRCRPTTAEQ